MIKITSKKAGFRRCGIAHPTTPTEYPNDKFSADQLELLKKEPMVVVEIIEDEALSAKELAAKIAAAETQEAIDALISENEKRKGVLDAAEKRRAELVE